ncbi:uncharacterized protein LOC112049114 [Bicyclus anynana]|uniref:Uncharacterized protein LOC112049114 n=1 Tax=Bicyclus anynana TaxID=110368 RepID=A0A6J1NHR9_BICAN|nr:uncharacterized protein LOC112049114 [Bicyclus anynana]
MPFLHFVNMPNAIIFLTTVCLVRTKKPFSKQLEATWRLECELGIISNVDCPIDGGWSPWAPWSVCHGTCDNVGHRKRLRECNNPSPSKDGMPCSGLDEEIESCYLNNCTTNDYRRLVEGDNSREQALNQLEAVPAFMDRCLQMECPFEAVEVALASENTWQLNSESLWNALQCVKHDIGCPVTGEWGTWGPWSLCGARCGKGQRWRTRKCDTPSPSDAHLVCPDTPLQNEECEGDQCAIDEEYSESNISGSWSEWGEWTKCSEDCGFGIQRRKRTCIEKHISNFALTWGTHCRGQYDDLQVCSNKKCLLNGGWSGWRAWGPCSQSCGAGRRSRSRSCTRPIPSGDGIACLGPKVEVGTCHLIPCEVYTHMIGVFNGDSFLHYYFPRKRSTFFHFYIRFMPLSPHGNLIRRGTQYPLIRLSLLRWHVCLDVNGILKSCSIPRMCSNIALEPATWNTIVLTVTNEAASFRLNDAQTSIHGLFPCDPEFKNDVMNIYLCERFHGEVQEFILNFIPLNMIIERESKTDQSDFFPSSASNMAYEKANMEEAYLNIQKDQYLRLPCSLIQEEWNLEVTIKSKRDGGTFIFVPTSNNKWFYMTLQNMRIKMKLTHDDFKSEATSSTEFLPDEWISITVDKKRETNTIEVALNAGERLHVFLIEDLRRHQDTSKRFRSCNTLKNVIDEKQSTKNLQFKTYNNGTKQIEICTDEFFVGGVPWNIQNSLFEDITPFSGVIAYLKVNNKLLDLHDYTTERDKDGVVQVSSRTASISGSYHETTWGESNKLNLTCLYARNSRSSAAYWLYLDTVIKFNNNVRPDDNGRVLRLIIVTTNNDPKGFYTCRVRDNLRTRNYVTYGVLGKINYRRSRPDTISVIAVCTTLGLVIFTLAWLILEGYYDIRDGYGFYRDAHLSPEEEAEVVCKYIDQNMHLIGSESAVNIAKANARRRGRTLASRASFGLHEHGVLNIEKHLGEKLSKYVPNEPEISLPEKKILDIGPSQEAFRCEPTYVSSPCHGSNITSCGAKLTSSSSPITSPRLLCSRLLMTKYKSVHKERFHKNKSRGSNLHAKDKPRLLTIKSSVIFNKSPVQKVLQKFSDLKSVDT